jgi:hypothetical protein
MKMQLTDYHRQAIIACIMAELPKVDEEKLRQDIQAALVKAMSAPVRKVYRENPKALRDARFYECDTGLRHSRSFVVGDADSDAVLKPFKEAAQARAAIESKLTAAIKACRTRKQFVDQFPEFSAYAPAEPGKSSNLPAVANVVADMMKLGWVPRVTRGEA